MGGEMKFKVGDYVQASWVGRFTKGKIIEADIYPNLDSAEIWYKLENSSLNYKEEEISLVTLVGSTIEIKLPEAYTAGLNKDDGKLRVDLVPMCVNVAIAEVLGQACRPDKDGNPPKYPERNWEKGIKFSRIFANVFRHLVIEWWWKGHDVDPESGLHPLKHAICRLAMLLFYIEKGMVEFDDRPSKSKV